MPDEIVDKGWNRIQRELEQASTSYVAIGIHDDGETHEDGETTVAQVAAFHEFGIGVPERAFLAKTAEEQTDELTRLAERLELEGVASGRMTTRQALAVIGQRGEDKVREKLRTGDPEWPPLADSTIAKKGSTAPLIDTGQMIQSVRYQVKGAADGGS